MADFEKAILERLPLAEAAGLLLRHVADESLLERLFEEHRGTGSSQKVSFPLLVELVGDALTMYGGSGRESFHQASLDGRLTATAEAVYGKLRRLPPELSEAFARETAERLRVVLPGCVANDVPPALRGHRVLIVDGKKLKRLPKRLKPLRDVRGKMLGGKVVAGLLLGEGLLVAMEATLDGEANDAPLTPGLLEQCEAQFTGPLLYVADRQFCDLKIPNRIIASGQSFLIRYNKKMLFYAEKEAFSADAQGRRVREAWGWLGSEKDSRRLYLRQITLERPAEEDVILVTNLLDAQQFPADQLLEAYLARWTIERVFQQVTEVFHLRKFIGTSPQGAVFQFAFCALLYNVIQVIRSYIATLQQRPTQSLSSEMIFRDVCEQLTASLVLMPRPSLVELLVQPRTIPEVRERLRELLTDVWSDLWIKCPAKKKRPPNPQQPANGGHSSAWKLLKAAKNKPPAPS